MQFGVEVKRRKASNFFMMRTRTLILENATESVPVDNFHVRNGHAKNVRFKNSGDSESD